ncbi:hypothetical protein FI615_001710 [Enterococcus faecium]|nr:hypothetical protein [Enterococcus faecium]EHK9936779.1 hypothetical protein [Enterococcus faecium]MBL3708371.1 hypothetical protein [Enterococcus faecium]
MTCTNCQKNMTNKASSPNKCNCDIKAMDVVTPHKKIQNGDESFCFSEIDDKACSNLAADKGIHPNSKHSNTDCEDLKSLNDLAIGSLHNSLLGLNFCDVGAFKCWLDSVLSWSWNITKAISCAICGIWSKIHWLENNLIIDDYLTVVKTYQAVMPASSFRLLSGANKIYGAPKPNTEHYISIPVDKMDIVDTVVAQPAVVGSRVHAAVVTIQDAYREGNIFKVNFDVYEIEGNKSSDGYGVPYDLPINFVVFGRKKIR